MKSPWTVRRSHIRHLSNGRRVDVRECLVLCGEQTQQPSEPRGRKCPYCGAKIISLPMRKGGWVHFEGRPGLTRIKHPCFYWGASLSKKRDDQTADLFEIVSYLEKSEN